MSLKHSIHVSRPTDSNKKDDNKSHRLFYLESVVSDAKCSTMHKGYGHK